MKAKDMGLDPAEAKIADGEALGRLEKYFEVCKTDPNFSLAGDADGSILRTIIRPYFKSLGLDETDERQQDSIAEKESLVAKKLYKIQDSHRKEKSRIEQEKSEEIAVFERDIHRKILLEMGPEERKILLAYLELLRSTMEGVKEDLV